MRVVKTFDPSKGRTRQEFKQDCDVNHIMKRAYRDGVITHLKRTPPEYGEQPHLELQEALELVATAREDFLTLPGRAREHFNHDPVKFLEYMHTDPDPDLLAELGLSAPPGYPPKPENPIDTPEAPPSAPESAPEPR